MSRFPLLTCCFQSTLVSLQSISTSCSSTYCNGHIYTRKWSGLQPWDQVALQKSVCLSLPPWTFSPKIRIVSSCHLSHASPSPKPHRLYLVHSVFFTRFSISTIAYIIFFTHVFFYCLLHECQPYGLISSPCVNSGRNAIVADLLKGKTSAILRCFSPSLVLSKDWVVLAEVLKQSKADH